nr:PhoH family protein [Lachnospiraceae bacterium]
MSIVELSVDLPAEHEKNIFGAYDEHLKSIERTLHVEVSARNGTLRITGAPINAAKAKRLFAQLLSLSERGSEITAQSVQYALSLLMDDMEGEMEGLDSDIIIHTMAGRPIKPKTLGQKAYVDSIRNRMITFGIGPAGTGKTYLAMAMAIRAFRRDEVARIILTRPAIEAGERLGFLPGDLQSKIDPYLRPLYDALYEIMGAENYLRNSEKGLIEVAPLAYMRGRTLDNAFIIL